MKGVVIQGVFHADNGTKWCEDCGEKITEPCGNCHCHADCATCDPTILGGAGE